MRYYLGEISHKEYPIFRKIILDVDCRLSASILEKIAYIGIRSKFHNESLYTVGHSISKVLYYN